MSHTAFADSILKAWVTRREPVFTAVHLTPEVTTFDHRGAYLDVTDERVWARVTVWPELIADFEIVDAESSEQIDWQHVEQASQLHLDQWLERTICASLNRAQPQGAHNKAPKGVIELLNRFSDSKEVPKELDEAVALIAQVLNSLSLQQNAGVAEGWEDGADGGAHPVGNGRAIAPTPLQPKRHRR